MTAAAFPAPRRIGTAPRERASVLVTALLLAFAIGFGVVGYLKLAHGTFVNSQRTLYLKDASALAEAGLEEALYCFHQLDAGKPTATAWTGWTITGTNATRELPSFNCDQNAIGTVRIYVSGCDGATATPFVMSQAAIAPFDGTAPVRKTLQIKLRKATTLVQGIVARNGLTFKGQASADSFISNPSGGATGPWLAYPGTGARANTTVIVPAGAISLGAQNTISGNLALGPGVATPSKGTVTGQIIPNYTGTFPLPTYPTAAGVTQSYNLGKTVPATLPRATDTPASDGRYYYFLSGASIASTTIAAGKAVTFVGTTTSFDNSFVLQTGASCLVYIDGPITVSGNSSNSNGSGNNNNNSNGSGSYSGNGNNGGNGGITNPNWAGALQIFTSTKADCSIGGSAPIYACVYAPNAALDCSGSGNSGMLVGSFVANTISSTGHMDFHYDESLKAGGAGGAWAPTSWFDLQSATDRASVAGLTGNYLR